MYGSGIYLSPMSSISFGYSGERVFTDQVCAPLVLCVPGAAFSWRRKLIGRICIALFLLNPRQEQNKVHVSRRLHENPLMCPRSYVCFVSFKISFHLGSVVSIGIPASIKSEKQSDIALYNPGV